MPSTSDKPSAAAWLLADLKYPRRKPRPLPGKTWVETLCAFAHRDGTPVTEAEASLIASATVADFQTAELLTGLHWWPGAEAFTSPANDEE